MLVPKKLFKPPHFGFREKHGARNRDKPLRDRPKVSGEALDALEWFHGFQRYRGMHIDVNSPGRRNIGNAMLVGMNSFRKNAHTKIIKNKRVLFADKYSDVPLHKLNLEEISREMACAIVEELPREEWVRIGREKDYDNYRGLKALHAEPSEKRKDKAVGFFSASEEYKQNMRVRGGKVFTNPTAKKPVEELSLRELRGTLATWLTDSYIKNFKKRKP